MKKLNDFSLFLITHESVTTPKQLENLVESAIQGGVTAFVLREKETPVREMLEKAKKAKQLLQGSNIPLIINDRVDVALAAQSDGVQLGQTDMPYPDARRLLGEDAIIGITVEDIDQALQAEQYDVSYLKVSQIFPSLTKPVSRLAWQLEGLEKLRLMSSKKLIAVGGITPHNVIDVIAAGADGIGVASAICHQLNPAQASKTLREIVDQGRARGKGQAYKKEEEYL